MEQKKMSFGEAVGSVFSKYAKFSGRARRSEYWYFVLLNALIGLVVSVLVSGFGYNRFVSCLGIAYLVYAIGILIPSLAVCVRRLHDSGKSGWLFLIVLVPFFGAVALIVLLCLDSNPGANRYGESPKYILPPDKSKDVSPAEASAQEYLFCPDCGERLPDGSAVCPACGCRVK